MKKTQEFHAWAVMCHGPGCPLLTKAGRALCLYESKKEAEESGVFDSADTAVPVTVVAFVEEPLGLAVPSDEAIGREVVAEANRLLAPNGTLHADEEERVRIGGRLRRRFGGTTA